MLSESQKCTFPIEIKPNRVKEIIIRVGFFIMALPLLIASVIWTVIVITGFIETRDFNILYQLLFSVPGIFISFIFLLASLFSDFYIIRLYEDRMEGGYINRGKWHKEDETYFRDIESIESYVKTRRTKNATYYIDMLEIRSSTSKRTIKIPIDGYKSKDVVFMIEYILNHNEQIDIKELGSKWLPLNVSNK